MGSIWNGYMCIVLYLPSLVQQYSRHLCSIGGGGGVNLPLVYVHCAIPARSAKFGVAVFKASMLD